MTDLRNPLHHELAATLPKLVCRGTAALEFAAGCDDVGDGSGRRRYVLLATMSVALSSTPTTTAEWRAAGGDQPHWSLAGRSRLPVRAEGTVSNQESDVYSSPA